PVTRIVDVTNFQWSLLLQGSDIPQDCACQRQVTITAECLSDPTCRATLVSDLDCPDPCCTLTLNWVSPGPFDQLRKRTATFTVTCPTLSTVTLNYGNGPQQVLVFSGTTVLTNSYLPGSYKATLTTQSPQGCPPAAVAVTVPICPSPPPPP